MGSIQEQYSSCEESSRIRDILCTLFDSIGLPEEVQTKAKDVKFVAHRDAPYFPIPFKETETTAALKAIEGSIVSLLAGLRDESAQDKQVTVNLEKTTAFLFQAYLATVGGLGKLDKNVRSLLKGKMISDSHEEKEAVVRVTWIEV